MITKIIDVHCKNVNTMEGGSKRRRERMKGGKKGRQ